MGRANSKPRKKKGNRSPQHPQHLAKVGSKPDLRDEGQRERSAVMDVMGMGNMSSCTKQAVFWIGTVIMVAAILAIVILTAKPF